MKKLLSLPPNVVQSFHDITHHSRQEFYCTSDPANQKLGSGGGTAWLLSSAHADECPEVSFEEWLSKESRILLHAGGQSRRLPSYAPSGKILTPIPVFRWAAKRKHRRPLFTKYSLYTLQANDRFSHDKATCELGYRPRDIVKTLRDTVSWYKYKTVTA